MKFTYGNVRSAMVCAMVENLVPFAGKDEH